MQDLGANPSDEELIAHELQKAFVRQQASYIKDLLNLKLPAGFADERLMQRPVHEIWRAVEKRLRAQHPIWSGGACGKIREDCELGFQGRGAPLSATQPCKRPSKPEQQRSAENGADISVADAGQGSGYAAWSSLGIGHHVYARGIHD
ncbi:hypothetical protein PC111_g14930 [Phytophthora cactorum]|nr:hypothetical protein PC112_g15744 [Phytophthora cactorum]KAG2812142.1 hypothetical protein PC111_g14930 [Phytophthora cactorum]KAG2890214.1 hypothetical protein PC114_g17576 [Phytophthora cactorum]